MPEPGSASLALAALLNDEVAAESSAGALNLPTSRLSPKAPHFTPRDETSHLSVHARRTVASRHLRPQTAVDPGRRPAVPQALSGQTRKLLASPWKFAQYGQSGLDVSELFPHVATRIDDVCVIRSMVSDDPNHPGGCLLMNTGERVFSRPSLGAWITYGLGTENQNLPGFVAIGPGPLIEGARQYGASFLPAAYQGTFVSDMQHPLHNLTNSAASSGAAAARARRARATQSIAPGPLRPTTAAWSAGSNRSSWPIACRRKAPEAFDLAEETPATERLYGIDQPDHRIFGRQCLLARRLVERGRALRAALSHDGRFPAVGSARRSEGRSREQRAGHRSADRRSCADLKARGLLDETLVIWGGEFGRTPSCEGAANGRDHHPYGFTMWLAGGGVRGGLAYGATDEFGWDAVENRVHVHDLHATILHLLGLDHERLTYRFAGRDYRLTDVSGQVVHGVLT